MSLTAAAGIAAGGNILGSTIGGAFSAYGASKADKANAQMIEKQLAWEREKFQTAHQVEMKDLKAAGMNPILTAGGSGASAGGITPIASEQAIGYGKAGELVAGGLAEAINSAMGSAKTISELGKIKEEINSMKTKQKLDEAQTGLATATANKTKQEAIKINYENELLNTMTPQMRQLTEIGFRAIESGGDVMSAIMTIKKLGMFKKLPPIKQKIILKTVKKHKW